jgi:hypothetical protein
MKKTTQTINTSLIGITVSVPNNFTALHLAYIAWNLYCDTAPTIYKNEFSISEASDFAHYNIHDRIDKAQHFYDSAYTIKNAVEENIDYSVQDAYDYIDDSFRADTIVREDLSFELVAAVEQFVKSKDYADATDWIAEDYLILREQQTA